MAKKQTWRDKKFAEIKSWGQLSLFRHLKDCWDAKMESQRNIVFSMGALTYEGSNLETHDKYVQAVNYAWDREFQKLYEQFEKNNS